MKIDQRPLLIALLVEAVLMSAACDSFPGIDAIGVRQAKTNGIEVTKALCPGDRVMEVELLLAPGGDPQDDEGGILWRITSEAGSTKSSYAIGVVPSGFVETVPLTRNLGPTLGLAATIATRHDAPALMDFEPRELRVEELLTPDGYQDSAEFEARYLERCAS